MISIKHHNLLNDIRLWNDKYNSLNIKYSAEYDSSKANP